MRCDAQTTRCIKSEDGVVLSLVVAASDFHTLSYICHGYSNKSQFITSSSLVVTVFDDFSFDHLQSVFFTRNKDKIEHPYRENYVYFSPLNTKRRLLYLKTQFVPRCKHLFAYLHFVKIFSENVLNVGILTL